MTIQKKLGKRIQTLRNKRGLSQTQLSEICGLHRTYISVVENGVKNLTVVNLEKIADALGVEIRDLF